MSVASVEERLVELELRFLTLQDELEKLSSVVYEQQLELNRNATEIRRLRETIASGLLSEGMPHEKPPHY